MTSIERRHAVITDEGVAALRSRIGIPVLVPDDIGKYTQINADAARCFAIACGDANPLYTKADHARSSRWGATIAPPHLLLAAGIPEGRALTPEEIETGRGGGLPGVHGLFAGRDFEWYQPMLDGDTISKVTYVADVREKEGQFAGRQVLQMHETLFRNQRHEVVAKMLGWRMRTERDTARARKKYTREPHAWTEAELERVWDAYEREVPRGAEPRYWEDVQVGEDMGTMARGPFRATDSVAWEMGWGGPYARTGKVEYEYRKRHPKAFVPDRLGIPDVVERVHWDPALAQEIGAPAIYDYGAQRVAWTANFLTNWQGDDGWLKRMWVQVRRFNIEGDVQWYHGQVIEKRILDGECQVICDVWAENQEGELTTPAQAVVVLPSREHGPVQLPAKGQPAYPSWGPGVKVTPAGVEPFEPFSTTHGILPVGIER